MITEAAITDSRHNSSKTVEISRSVINRRVQTAIIITGDKGTTVIAQRSTTGGSSSSRTTVTPARASHHPLGATALHAHHTENLCSAERIFLTASLAPVLIFYCLYI